VVQVDLLDGGTFPFWSTRFGLKRVMNPSWSGFSIVTGVTSTSF
jgi:hypothetical protein